MPTNGPIGSIEEENNLPCNMNDMPLEVISHYYCLMGVHQGGVEVWHERSQGNSLQINKIWANREHESQSVFGPMSLWNKVQL